LNTSPTFTLDARYSPSLTPLPHSLWTRDTLPSLTPLPHSSPTFSPDARQLVRYRGQDVRLNGHRVGASLPRLIRRGSNSLEDTRDGNNGRKLYFHYAGWVRQDLSARKNIRTGGGPPQKEEAYTAVLEEAIGMEKSDLIRVPSSSLNAKLLDESCAYDISMDNIDDHTQSKRDEFRVIELKTPLVQLPSLPRLLTDESSDTDGLCLLEEGIVDQITCEADSQQAPKRRKLFCSTPVSANYHTKASSGGSKNESNLYQKLLQREQLDIIDLKGRKLKKR
ncbi:hypothetical protein RRG08_049803, partial [Elysia crispata]